MVYITGDTHGEFERVYEFCLSNNTNKKDILIILGDAGINFYNDIRDIKLKEMLEQLPITLFCIHGNHEIRPNNISTYKVKQFHKGKVYIEDKYPNIIFAKDGEVYDFNNLKTLVIGGAYSVDKMFRQEGYNWWRDELPNDKIKNYVLKQLDENDYKVDVVLSHTICEKYMPVNSEYIFGEKVDKSLEVWLDKIEDKLDYKKWYYGHFHVEKTLDKTRGIFNDILEFIK